MMSAVLSSSLCNANMPRTVSMSRSGWRLLYRVANMPVGHATPTWAPAWTASAKAISTAVLFPLPAGPSTTVGVLAFSSCSRPRGPGFHLVILWPLSKQRVSNSSTDGLDDLCLLRCHLDVGAGHFCNSVQRGLRLLLHCHLSGKVGVDQLDAGRQHGQCVLHVRFAASLLLQFGSNSLRISPEATAMQHTESEKFQVLWQFLCVLDPKVIDILEGHVQEQPLAVVSIVGVCVHDVWLPASCRLADAR